jgi:hypothetical protein
MKGLIRLIILGVSITQLQVGYSYPQGFSEFVYNGKGDYNPFTGGMNDKQIYYESSCKVEGFPAFDKSVKCNTNGQLVIDNDSTNRYEDTVSSVEGILVGLFALSEKRHMLVKLKNANHNMEINCENQDAYILPIIEDSSNETVQIAVNSLIFGYTLRFNIQGCELGRPKIIDFEVLDCSSKKCQSSLKTPLLSWEKIRFKTPVKTPGSDQAK